MGTVVAITVGSGLGAFVGIADGTGVALAGVRALWQANITAVRASKTKDRNLSSNWNPLVA